MIPFQQEVPIGPSRPKHYSEIVHQLHPGGWFYWADSKNKVYENLRLVEKVYDQEAYAKNPNGPLVMKPNPIKNLPSLDELNDQLLKSQKEWDDKFSSYKRPRLDEYPSLREQLDMIYHEIENGKLDKTGSFYKSIKAVKDKYPIMGDT